MYNTPVDQNIQTSIYAMMERARQELVVVVTEKSLQGMMECRGKGHLPDGIDVGNKTEYVIEKGLLDFHFDHSAWPKLKEYEAGEKLQQNDYQGATIGGGSVQNKMYEWQTVGKRSTCSKVFDGEKGFDDEFAALEKPRSIGSFVAVAEDSDDPLRAVLGASWFPILSQSELSRDDLNEVLHVLELVQRQSAPSNELSDFLVQTLDHGEAKSALRRLLETKCYEIEHLMVICRYVEQIEACLTAEKTLSKTRFKSIALVLHCEFLKGEHTSGDEESFRLATDYIERFLGGFDTEEFEQKPIAGYPSGHLPPESFRFIPTCPRTQDVDGGLPFLRPNIEKGPYRDLDDYLDIHYRLLREEYMGSLRGGIRDLRKGDFSHDLVSFTGEKTANGDIASESGTVRLRITSNAGRMQEFKTGVLVALARDGLNGFIYLTCLETDRATVTLEFCNSSDSLSFKLTRSHQLLVLKSAYYEAFRHTLDALKSIVELPFQSCIVDCVLDESHPKHWRRADQRTLLLENQKKMNKAQYEAFHQTLLRKVCLIQGPPGTGKTYVGLRIVETILKHRITESPVLVVCYTNHALDQFLEGMLNFTSSIVRIGGRSKSEKLAPYSFENVRNETQKKNFLSKEDRLRRVESYERIELCRKRLLEDEQLLGVIQGNANILPIIRRTFFRQSEVSKLSDEFSKIPDCSEFLEVSKLCKDYEANEKLFKSSSSPSDDLEAYVSLKMCSGDISEKVIADRMRKSRMLNRWAFSRVAEKIQYEYCGKGVKPRHKLTLNEKWRFYATLHWKKVTEDDRVDLNEEHLKDPSRFEQKCLDIQKRLAERHRRYAEQLAENINVVNQFKAMQTATLLRSKSIIGLTTTGAAKRRSLLHELNCQIIVVEEAAEILEAHLVAILPQRTQQIILIGDHKQLSPCINNYTLERCFNFGVSLFERLVNNGMPYVMLNVQHRMKNHFLKLLVPHIYDHITSSPKVYELESIRGMSKDLQFLSHNCQERRTGKDSASKSNVYEASMIVALLGHLAYQGYGPEDIVVLCAYAGQQQYVSDLLQLKGSVRTPRVSTVDDYQGEECDIVIVSFVRCNPQNEIGFLAKPNRVCVALSRARKGLFCFGDFKAYASKSTVWKGILDTLIELGAVNRHIELKCSAHGTLAQVSNPEQFAQYMPLGRCQRICDVVLACGHPCTHPCHGNDTHPLCRKPCLYEHPECGHRCRRKCYQNHGTCEETVPKLLACGHTEYALCIEPAISLQCHERCQKELACGHQCGGLCSKPCNQDCMVKVLITRVCDHDAVVACSEREQKRAQEFCTTKVNVELNCGHSARIPCNRSMNLVTLTSSCTVLVTNVALPCGHIHSMPCMEFQSLELYRCKRRVGIELLCGHPHESLCYQLTDATHIPKETLKCETAVQTTATCGHSMNIACRLSVNAAQFCVETVEVELACGHSRLTACRRARNEVELGKMKATCAERVFVEAPCNHLVEVACNAKNNETNLLSSCKVVVSVASHCGHNVDVICSSSQNAEFVLKLCQLGKTMKLICNHTIHIKCSDLRSREEISKDCKQKVQKILKCNHAVEQICKGTLGDLEVKCKRKCEFTHRCGHTCTGNCTSCRGGQNHRPCRLDCTQTLPCGHPCGGKCGRRCGPCKAPCQRQCAHGQCEQKCEAPCSSKSQTCRRRGGFHCPHQRCGARNCWECVCDPCEKECTKKLENCGHPCEGMCNEPCVPCFRCKPKRLQKLFGRETVSGKFLQVPGCNHLVDAEIMDQVMASWQVGIPRCINCDANIPAWIRYNCVYNRTHRTSKPDQRKLLDVKHATDQLLAKIHRVKSEVALNEFREDSEDREMVRHYVNQILTDLSFRLMRWKSEDVMLCDLVFQVVESLVKVHEDVFRVKDCFPREHPLQERIFFLSRDIFEDLAAMVDMKLEDKSSWMLSTLDDVSTQALRLKSFTLLLSVTTNIQAQLLDLIFAEGRFSLAAANALLRQSDPKLKIQPFYDSDVRGYRRRL